MTSPEHSPVPFLSFGFRPFFLAGAAYAVVAMCVWLAVYRFGLTVHFHGLPPGLWHAHEMIFGYSLAVIAGFLLTAVMNWTGRPTLQGAALLPLLLFWLGARLAFHLPGAAIYAAAVFDTLFIIYLSAGILKPIIATRQRQQLGIVVMVTLIGTGNLVFYLGAMGIIGQGAQWGFYTGFYLVIGLILTIGRRVIPFFVERGVGYAVELRNSGAVDIAALIGLVAFLVVEVFTSNRLLSATLAGILFVVHLYRLSGWYTPGIWRKPLLWSLFLAYAFMILGFGLLLASAWHEILWFPALHAFAVGGIGLITLSMMSRVSLGHTGRDINQPPRGLTFFLLMLVTAAVLRVFLPPLSPQRYTDWILISQLLWIIAFAGFVVLYSPILCKASKPSGNPH